MKSAIPSLYCIPNETTGRSEMYASSTPTLRYQTKHFTVIISKPQFSETAFYIKGTLNITSLDEILNHE
jgi:hypothetical protein